MDTFSPSFPDLQDVRVADANDEFRETLKGGRVVYTRGVHALGEEQVSAVLKKVRTFDAFTQAGRIRTRRRPTCSCTSTCRAPAAAPAYLEIDKLPEGRYQATVGTLFEHQTAVTRFSPN